MRAFIVSLLALVCACAPTAAEDVEVADQWTAVDVQSTPIELGAERVGRLTFRGGIVLDSDSHFFGGLSGMEVLENDRALFISDRGEWFEGRLTFDDVGTLTGFVDVRTAPMRDARGRPFEIRDDGDSEALTQMRDGRLAVSFEQVPRILIYDVNRDGPFGAALEGPPLAGADRLPSNASLEALAVDGDGNFIVGAEGGGGATPVWVLPLNAREPTPARFAYRLGLGYSLTALDRGPNGGYFALERFYAPIIGARARVMYWPETAFAEPGAIEGAEELALLAPPLVLDNFEAISAVRRADGGVRLYIASDDNQSQRQRTLIYAFDLESY
ncbi:MAG: esterase-like activity of phytase family protein [Hyphomonadaceae bacterium]|nr:esterase-like activity of phytase family protein [Hyphomonadaceae bacterium]